NGETGCGGGPGIEEMKLLCAVGFVSLFFAVSSSAEEISDMSNWVTLSAGNAFSMRAPADTKFKKIQAIDSFASAFENPKFEINFDYGLYSNTLSDMRSDPAYKSEDILMDGRKGILVTGPGKGQW